jgi:hypothetical protein
MGPRWLEAAPRRVRPIRPFRRCRDHRIVIEFMEDRVAPVVGALAFAPSVVLNGADPLVASGSSSSGIVAIRPPGGGLGTGELLSTGRDVLTAAHVVTDNSGAIVPGNFTITFQLPTVMTFTVPSTAITVNPGWNGVATHGSDLAIIALPTQAPAAASRYPLFTGNNEAGQTFNLEGFGETGVGATGSTADGFLNTAGVLRSGNNSFDGTDQIFAMPQANPVPASTPVPGAGFPANSALVYDFDDGMAAHDSLGFYYGVVGLGVPGESLAAHGDSGGPDFLGNAIAGVVSYGFGFPTNPPDILPGNNDSFGEVEVDTRVSFFANWINAVINVNRLQVGLPASVTAGVAFAINVAAVNAFGNVIPGYTGTVAFTSSDTNAGVTLPANYTFVAADNGRHVFPVAGAVTTLITSGSQSITATDTTSPTFTGYGTTTVNAAATSQFTVIPLNQTAIPFVPLPVIAGVVPTTVGPAGTGRPLPFVLFAEDMFGNTTPNYRGTVMFTSTDAAANLPANYTFVATDLGSHIFRGTVASPSITYNTVGDRTLTATDTAVAAINGQATIRLVDSTTAVGLSITIPPQVTAGTAFSVTVQAVNAFGGVATGYRGTVRFLTSDTNAAVVLPANYAFVAADNGVHTFTNMVTLATAGIQLLRARDTVNATLVTTGNTNVNPAATAALVVTVNPVTANVVTNVPFGVTVQATDMFGNTTPAYRGTINFTTSDVAVGFVVPANYTYVAGDNGIHTFPNGVTLVTPGAQTVTATDTVVAATTGTVNVTVGAPVLNRFRIVASVNTTMAGNPFMVTVTAQDALGNTVTGYRGTVTFTSSDPNLAMRMLPANYMFVAGDNGVHTFNGVILATAGAQTITATDTVMGAVMGVTTVTVTPAAAATLVVAPAAGQVLLGVPATFTVTARDRFGNIATGYRGIVMITSNDALATIPANVMFTATDNGVHTFTGASAIIFGTVAAARPITATDTVNAGVNGTANVAVVAPAAVATLSVQIIGLAPSTVVGLTAVNSGQLFSIVVTALDANGFATTAYTGTVTFASTDAAAGVILPPNTIFAATDLGTKTFTGLKLITRGRIATITATDTVNRAITGSGRVIVI